MCEDGTGVDLRYLLWRDLLWQLKSFPKPNKESHCGNVYSGDRLQKMSIKQTVSLFLNMWFMMFDKGNDI